MGAPEEFGYAGREKLDGVDCHVVCAWAVWHRYYISVADGRLRGVKEGTQTRPDFVARLLDCLRKEGHSFRNAEQWADWVKTRDPEEARAVDRRLAANMLTLTEPIFEFGLADYKEVAPGCLLPMTQTCAIRFIDEDGTNAVDLNKVIKITDVHVNERLPDALFTVEPEEGTQVLDQTHNPPLKYRHKASFTDDEWREIVADGKARAARDKTRQRKLHALIGRFAPEFPPDANWFNGKPIRWSDLAGKSVVLDFWAEWSVPCRDDLRTLSALHKTQADDGLVVIGAHPAGSDPAAIAKVIKEFDLGYPTCVDARLLPQGTGWGQLYEQLGVDRIPFAVLINPDGKIAAVGELNEVLLEAAKNHAR
jgi:thiol-disulfide isomerase/thioredoxin